MSLSHINMTFMTLPYTSLKGRNEPWKYINITQSDKSPDIMLSYSLRHYLSEIKNRINSLPNLDDWDTYKKFTNPYEFINGNPSKHFVCNYKPLSRAYFKMLEIINSFGVINVPRSKPIKMFGLAEGPGGFIEAVYNHRNNTADVYYGMTIENPADDNVPGWKRTRNFLRNAPNIFLERGADQTGNMLSVENFTHVVNAHKNSVDIVTADGGFDFSSDFNSQELSMHQLLFAQIAYAVCIQKIGGSFVLKIFDCFYKATVDMIFLLTMFYDNVSIVKPCTSRLANSEKYIVCTNFRFNNSNVYFDYFAKALEKCCQPNIFFTSVLQNIRPPLYFYSKLEEINLIFGKSQIENIFNTLSLIDNKFKTDKIDFLIKSNKTKCSNWCIKNRVSYFIPETDNPFVRKIKDDNKDESKYV